MISTKERVFSRREFIKGGLGLFFPEIEPLRTVHCPIYYFHEVYDSKQLANFVTGLLDQGNTPIGLNTLVNYLITGDKSWESDPFILTFDDGLRSQKQNAFPFLVQYQIPSVFAVMPTWKGDGVHYYMSHNDFAQLSESGMEVISHTLNHPTLSSLRSKNYGAWLSEIIESKQILEQIINKAVNFFCYPNGAYDTETAEVVGKYYKAALTTRSGVEQRSDELLVLPRTRKS